jgi:hypothetical protein
MSEEKMKEEYRARIEEIIDGMQCSKGFKCAEVALNRTH